MIKKVVAKKSFSLEDQHTGIKTDIAKGDTGELLGNRAYRGYTIIINDKTVYIQERKLLRYLFKVE